MNTVIVTGAAGLIGSESVKRFAREGFKVVGIDNDLRQWFFGKEASTLGNRQKLIQAFPNYEHHDFDIRDRAAVEALFKKLGPEIVLVIHTAAQPSHDWAARDPHADFGVNALGTLNLLQATHLFCPEAVFIFTSTNKVYGDTPNRLPLVELDRRWEIKPGHEYQPGISETMSIDQTKHSLFGASKVAARRAGIDIKRLTLKIYLLSALGAGLAGAMYTGRFTAGAAQAGEPLLLDSIAAVVIGGASLFGGSGTIWGTIAGALVIAVIQYGLVFINVEPFWQFIAVGAVIIVSVLVDQTQRNLTGGRQVE